MSNVINIKEPKTVYTGQEILDSRIALGLDDGIMFKFFAVVSQYDPAIVAKLDFDKVGKKDKEYLEELLLSLESDVDAISFMSVPLFFVNDKVDLRQCIANHFDVWRASLGLRDKSAKVFNPNDIPFEEQKELIWWVWTVVRQGEERTVETTLGSTLSSDGTYMSTDDTNDLLVHNGLPRLEGDYKSDEYVFALRMFINKTREWLVSHGETRL